MAKFTIHGGENGLDKGTLMLVAKFITLVGGMTVITADLAVFCCCMG